MNTLGQVWIRAKARPIRVAYLVPIADEPHEIISAVIAEAYNRWGGLYTAIVPVDSGKIDDHYMLWLQYVDPDIVYSYADLSNDSLRAINSLLMPYLVCRHNDAIGRVQPSYGEAPLDSISVVPMLSEQRNIAFPHLRALVEASYDWPEDAFITDSFGVRRSSALDVQLRRYVESVQLVRTPNDPLVPAQFRASIEVLDSTSLLQRMNSDFGIRTLASLAAAETGIRDEGFHPWARSYSLIVGDTALDRISFWNGRTQAPQHALRYTAALRIPSKLLEDDQLVAELANFVGRANAMTSAGSTFVTIRSSSISDADLAHFRDRIFAVNHAQIGIERIASAQDCLPNVEMMRQSLTGYIQRSSVKAPASESTVVRSAIPRHVEDAPNYTLQRTGYWANDIAVPRPGPSLESPFGNHGVWSIPRRSEALHAFCSEASARVNRRHELTLFSSFSNLDHDVRLNPVGSQVVASLFHSMPHGYQQDLRSTQLRPVSRYYTSSTSESGQLVLGALRFFNTLFEAYELICNRFWRSVFLRMADPSALPGSKAYDEVKARLKADWERSQRTSLSTDDDWNVVMASVLKNANHINSPTTIVSLDDLVEWRLDDVDRAKAADPRLDVDLGLIESDLVEAVTRMCARGIFIQGRSWKCARCSFANWKDVSGVRASMKCSVCGLPNTLPARFSWDFRLSDFLANGFRESDLLSLLWALGVLNMSVASCFAFAPPRLLYSTAQRASENKQDAEADLSCIMDGQFCIGEVKPKERYLTHGVLSNFKEIARVVEPDCIILACMEQGTEQKLSSVIDHLKSELNRPSLVIKAFCPGDEFERFSERVTL